MACRQRSTVDAGASKDPGLGFPRKTAAPQPGTPRNTRTGDQPRLAGCGPAVHADHLWQHDLPDGGALFFIRIRARLRGPVNTVENAPLKPRNGSCGLRFALPVLIQREFRLLRSFTLRVTTGAAAAQPGTLEKPLLRSPTGHEMRGTALRRGRAVFHSYPCPPARACQHR